MEFLKKLLAMGGNLVSGQPDDRLSERQNRSALKSSLVDAGLSTIQNSGPFQGANGSNPDALSAIAGGIQTGRASGADTRGQFAEQNALSIKDRMKDYKVEQQDSLLASMDLTTQDGQDEARITAMQVGGPELLGAVNNAIKERNESPYDISANGQIVDKATGDIIKEGRPSAGVSVNVGDGATDYLAEARGEHNATLYTTTQEDADSAQVQLTNVRTMRALNAEVGSGGAAGYTLRLRQLIGPMLGTDMTQTGQQEVFLAFANEMALGKKGELTGPMSDKDLAFLVAQVPNLKNTPSGNAILIALMERALERQVERALEADRYLDDGGDGSKLSEHLRQWTMSTDMYDDTALLQQIKEHSANPGEILKERENAFADVGAGG